MKKKKTCISSEVNNNKNVNMAPWVGMMFLIQYWDVPADIRY